jgi:LysR family glycine cleavage system transcriptional activator
LSAEQLFAVCSPKLLSGGQRLSKLADLLEFPLIHLDSRSDWTKWLRAAGLCEHNVTHGPVLNHESMVLDAAINGQGIALARTTPLPVEDILDCLSEGDVGHAEDRDVPRLAIG